MSRPFIGCSEPAFPKLTALRVERGWSKRELASRMRKAGYPQRLSIVEALVRRVEAFGQIPSPAFVVTLHRAIGLTLDDTLDLFEGEVEWSRSWPHL